MSRITTGPNLTSTRHTPVPVRPPRTGPTTGVSRPRPGRRSDLPRMSELAIDTADGGRVINLRRDPQAPARLPRGKAGGRYQCCACGTQLIFTGPATPDSHFTPRFRHTTARQHPEPEQLTFSLASDTLAAAQISAGQPQPQPQPAPPKAELSLVPTAPYTPFRG